MTQLTEEQQERLNRLIEHLKSTPVVCVCKPFCGHWEAHAAKVLAPLLDSDSQAAESPSHCALCEDPYFIYRDCVLDAATSMRDKCREVVLDYFTLNAQQMIAKYGTHIPQDAIQSLTLDPLEPEKQK